LQEAALAEWFDVLVVNHTAAGGHPEHVTGLQHTLVTIAYLTFDQKRGDLEACMRMRSARRRARRKVHAIVHQNDERIVAHEVVRVDDLHGGVAFAHEAGRGRRSGDDPVESACHHRFN
jgi:hypothetical protein